MLQNLFNNTSWLSGFFAGVIATLFGFICNAVWDIYKWRRENNVRLQAMFSMAIDEVKNNIRIAGRNNGLLSQELAILDQYKSNLNPLNHLRTGAWDLMKFHFPDFLIRNDLLPLVNSTSHLIEEINEVIRSRELYRLNNESMSNFREKMAKFDQLLTEQNNKLLKILSDIEAKTTKFIL